MYVPFRLPDAEAIFSTILAQSRIIAAKFAVGRCFRSAALSSSVGGLFALFEREVASTSRLRKYISSSSSTSLTVLESEVVLLLEEDSVAGLGSW